MGEKIRDMKIDIEADLSNLDEMLGEYEKIIDRMNFHYYGLKNAINDFKDYKPSLDIKYSSAAPSNKSCHDSIDEWVFINVSSLSSG